MSARAFQHPVTTWQGKWNRGVVRFPAGRAAAVVNITISPDFLTNQSTVFTPVVTRGGVWTKASRP